MKLEELMQIREQAILLAKGQQLLNVEKSYLGILNNELASGLERFLGAIYESFHLDINKNLQDDILTLDADFKEALKETEIRNLRYYVSEIYAKSLHRYKDECIDKEEVNYIMNQLSLQSYSDICSFDFTPPFSTATRETRGYFRKCDLIKRLKEDDFESYYRFVSSLDRKGNPIGSTIRFSIPITSYVETEGKHK